MLLYSETEFQKEIDNSIEHFKLRLKQLRVGRARADIFEDISVSPKSYGGMVMSLKSLANINVESALSISIQPFDKGIVEDIQKAIQEADLGYNPVSDGVKVRINIPPLTEETRKQTVKELHDMQEEAKVSIRQIRHKFNEEVEKQDGVSEDEQKRSKDTIQKGIDAANVKLEEISDNKEEELMSL